MREDNEMLLRRVRGLLVSSLLGAIPWAVFGVVAGIVASLQLRPGEVITSPLLFGSVILACTLIGAGIGAVNGAVFGGILMFAERRQGIDELRATRIGTWSALATGGTALVFSSSFMVAAVCALLGFGVGAVALRLAKRHASPDAQAAVDPPAT